VDDLVVQGNLQLPVGAGQDMFLHIELGHDCFLHKDSSLLGRKAVPSLCMIP